MKNRRIKKCPKCGSDRVAPILYGLPVFDEDLKRKIESEEIYLGGCCVGNADPQFHCFSRANEYIFFVQFGESSPVPLSLSNEWIVNGDTSITSEGFQWGSFVRQGTDGRRESRPNMFYPIFVSEDGKRFVDVGEPLPLGVDRATVKAPDGTIAIWPLHSDGSEGRWAYAILAQKTWLKEVFSVWGNLQRKAWVFPTQPLVHKPKSNQERFP